MPTFLLSLLLLFLLFVRPLLAQEPATPLPTADQLLRQFAATAFISDEALGAKVPTLFKWEQPFRLFVAAHVSEAVRVSFTRLMEQISAESEVPHSGTAVIDAATFGLAIGVPARTQGTPFFLIESLRTLASKGCAYGFLPVTHPIISAPA